MCILLSSNIHQIRLTCAPDGGPARRCHDICEQLTNLRRLPNCLELWSETDGIVPWEESDSPQALANACHDTRDQPQRTFSPPHRPPTLPSARRRGGRSEERREGEEGGRTC